MANLHHIPSNRNAYSIPHAGYGMAPPPPIRGELTRWALGTHGPRALAPFEASGELRMPGGTGTWWGCTTEEAAPHEGVACPPAQLPALAPPACLGVAW